jgi:hypothetical protein
MPANSTTPRTLSITIEVDVTEGPRIKRGVRNEDLHSAIGVPLQQVAEQLVMKELNLEPRATTVRCQFGYSWLDTGPRKTEYGPVVDDEEELVDLT